MNISQKLGDAINAQIGHELEATLQYLSMAAFFEEQNYAALANRMHAQVKEEFEHAMKFYHYLIDMGFPVVIPALPAPPTKYGSALAVFKAALAWEKIVTRNIYNLVEIALADKDYASQHFLGWFVEEQIEEEANMQKFVDLATKLGQEREFMLENFASHGG